MRWRRRCVDDEEAQLLLDDLLLHRSRQMLPDFFRPIGALRRKVAPGSPAPECRASAGSRTCGRPTKSAIADQIGGGDRRLAEAQMAARLRAGFVASRRRNSPAHIGPGPRPGSSRCSCWRPPCRRRQGRRTRQRTVSGGSMSKLGVDIEAGPADIIDDAEREAVLRFGLFQFVERGLYHRRVEILR